MYDFSKCKLSKKYYGGSEMKLGIIYLGRDYLIKFQKQSQFGYRFNHVSEYIGSHIFSMLGLTTHETLLGTYKGENVVACLDFLLDGYTFRAFNDIGESSIETNIDKYQYSYNDIIVLLKANKKLINVRDTINLFFQMYIIDALIGNFDRHGANWGFLMKNNNYILAPVFDNGSSLFPNLSSDEELLEIMNDEEEINKIIYKFPTSQIKLDGNKSSYFDVISSLKYKEINNALRIITPRINLETINCFIDDIDSISQTRKEFYKFILKQRFEKIILYSYEKLKRYEKRN